MMSRAEAKYKYLVNEEKYDPEVRQAVSKKSISHSDANKINAMQEMMRKEREERGSRNIITSENRADFMANKLGLEQPNQKMRLKKMDDEQHERAKKHPKYAMLKAKLGKRGAMDAILHELNMGDSEKSLPK